MPAEMDGLSPRVRQMVEWLVTNDAALREHRMIKIQFDAAGPKLSASYTAFSLVAPATSTTVSSV